VGVAFVYLYKSRKFVEIVRRSRLNTVATYRQLSGELPQLFIVGCTRMSSGVNADIRLENVIVMIWTANNTKR